MHQQHEWELVCEPFSDVIFVFIKDIKTDNGLFQRRKLIKFVTLLKCHAKCKQIQKIFFIFGYISFKIKRKINLKAKIAGESYQYANITNVRMQYFTISFFFLLICCCNSKCIICRNNACHIMLIYILYKLFLQSDNAIACVVRISVWLQKEAFKIIMKG